MSVSAALQDLVWITAVPWLVAGLTMFDMETSLCLPEEIAVLPVFVTMAHQTTAAEWTPACVV